MIKSIAPVTALLFWADAAVAASCPVSLGELVQLTSVETAFSDMPEIPLKDEFETTAEYNSRVARVAYTAGFIAIERDGDFPATYDADNSRYEVRDRDLFGNGFYYRAPYDYSGNGVTLTETDRTFFLTIDKQVTGTQKGSNAFGVEAEIVNEDWTRFYVYEGPRGRTSFRNMDTDFNRLEQVHNNPFLNEIDAHYFIVPVERDNARVLKGTMRRALVVRPRHPFQFEGRDTSSPTLDDPRNVKILDKFLVADVHCAIVTDGDGKVLRVIETND